MLEVQISEAQSRLAQLVDLVEHGETVVLVRDGRPVVRMEQEKHADRTGTLSALDRIEALGKTTQRVTLDEILASRHEGHRY